MTTTYDTIVIGLGAVGSACLYQLAKRGQRVLGIDRYAPPHGHGSSHGETRITRRAIGEGEAYVPLVTRSHDIWREIESETGLDLLTQCGALILSGRDNAANHHGKGDFVRRTIAAAKRFDIPHEVLDAAAIGARFPQFGLTGQEIGYFEPGGGFVRPERCIEGQLRLARRKGAGMLLDTQVVRFDPDGPGATAVTTAAGDRLVARHVVMAAGPWLGGMVGAEIGRHLSVCRQVLHWFGAEDEAAYAPGRFPVFIWMHGDAPEDYLYGFPVCPGSTGVKVATEQYSETTADPGALRTAVPAEEPAAMFRDHVAGRLRGVRPGALRSSACMYTVTPDSGFVVDWLPGHARVLMASACSGHGFKHSAGLGEAMARQIAGSDPVLPGFGADRLLTASLVSVHGC
ncbi:MAG: N-methyl-L-tryptophan oxidase [Gemmatimonadaceae bacterium]|nr:N-methyl-L-tryptophan oxidase [Acetobacteraceae bacterium]